MKGFSTVLLVIMLCGFSLMVISCGGKKGVPTDQQGKEYTSAYVCPMHCEGSGSHEFGKCPVCGMDYVKNEDHKSDEHQH